ncbi:DUF3592 domain-containing protein [Sedimentisphaera salicampi]|uniref:DUF3592 domain-containing protein n=1 Tax=Sedimentisphaera salicampi TaxID=1941349 RepID=A0A1W6LMC0_9BACT|nr:DUF3592 domain-containing protein [Sedimentisphaera salicampi]ARN56917.1 hypothetical protein STSP1_01310 [Sedimentisphaera salicampi]
MIYIFFAIVAIITVYSFIKFLSSANWVKTEGVILESRVDKFHNRNIEDTLRYQFKPVVRYSYTVNGAGYTGNNIFSGSKDVLMHSSADAEQMIEDYKKDKMVNVYYNPEKPEESCLISAGSLPKSFIAVLGIILLVIGSVIFMGIKFINKG